MTFPIPGFFDLRLREGCENQRRVPWSLPRVNGTFKERKGLDRCRRSLERVFTVDKGGLF